jgi:hypothetical protein
MPVLNLDFSADQYQRMLNSEIIVKDFIDQIINPNATNGKIYTDEICAQLKYNHNGDGGSPEIHEFEIASVDYNASSNTGSLRLNYAVKFFWGCSDIKKTHQYHEYCSFTVDKQTSTLKLNIPEPVVRDVSDEF